MKVVITTKKWQNIIEGSFIRVEKTTKRHYIGIWSSAMGSYYIKVPRTHALTYDRYLKLEERKLLKKWK